MRSNSLESCVLFSPKQASTRRTRWSGSSATPWRFAKQLLARFTVSGVSVKTQRVVLRASRGRISSHACWKHLGPSVCCMESPAKAPVIPRTECSACCSPFFCAIFSCPMMENMDLKVASCDRIFHSPAAVHLWMNCCRRPRTGSNSKTSSIKRFLVSLEDVPNKAHAQPFATKCCVIAKKTGSTFPAFWSMRGKSKLAKVWS